MRGIKQATSLCHVCPKLCRSSCPVADADQNEATTPWGKMGAMRLADEGRIPFDQKTASLAYKCLTCRASEETCEFDNPVPETLVHYRKEAFHGGVAPPEVYSYVSRFHKWTNPFGINLHQKLKRLFPAEFRKKPGDLLYFASCTELRYFPQTIGRTLKLLKNLGFEIGLSQEPISCCGYPLFAAGDEEGLRELAQVNFHLLQRTRELISASPVCLYTLGTLYGQYGFPLKTQLTHVSEKLLEFKKLSRRIPREKRVVAYHDPCYLGRYLGKYDEPRRVLSLKTGSPPLEFLRNREKSYCCGAGGLLPLTSPETARKITENRLQEFQKTGATTLVTACPSCVRQFQKVDRNLDVRGLVDFLTQ